MPLHVLALCFACGCLGAVAGVFLLFKLAKPHVLLTVDLVFKRRPICDECGKELGTKQFLETPATTTFPVTMKR